MPTKTPQKCKGCGETKKVPTDHTKNYPALAQALSEPSIWHHEHWANFPVARIADIRSQLEIRGVTLTGQGLSYLLRHARFPSRDVHGGTSWLPMHKKIENFITKHGGTVPEVTPQVKPTLQVSTAVPPSATSSSSDLETPGKLLSKLRAHFPGFSVELVIKAEREAR